MIEIVERQVDGSPVTFPDHLWFNVFMGTLYLVATPIGNLEDMSPRAVRTLREVRVIASEDTRVTRKLLAHFGLHTPLTSYFEHNKLTKLDAILSVLNEGDVALVSDAGTPAINDPGYELVRATLEGGHSVCPIPGPSAPVAALAASGLPTDSFLFLGYLPRKSPERQALLRQVENLPYTLILLESPHRVIGALKDLGNILGDRQIAVARELTKVHEEIWRGSIPAAHAYYSQNEARGEFTLVVAGQTNNKQQKWTDVQVNNAIRDSLKLDDSPSALAKRVAKESGWERKEIYKRVTSLRGKK